MQSIIGNVLKLNSGYDMPVIGYGTGLISEEVSERTVAQAIEIGYRCIDTAFMYPSEAAVGKVVRKCINDGSVTRDDLFIITKVWATFHRADLVKKSLLESLKKLQMNYVDLFLIHFPASLQEGGDLLPMDDKGQLVFSYADYLDTWKAMEKLVDQGLARSIGVCNFNSLQIQRILDSKPTHPVSNLQIEASPYFMNSKLVEWAQSKGIIVTAYRSMGGPNRREATPEDRILCNEVKVKQLAEKYSKTEAQVLLRWAIQKGCAVIPMTTNPERMTHNTEIFDFVISEDDMEILASFPQERSNEFFFSQWEKHKDYPFNAAIDF